MPFEQSVRFQAKLKEVGVEAILIKMVDAGHGFRSRELDERVQMFFDRHLRNVEGEISDEPIRVGR